MKLFMSILTITLTLSISFGQQDEKMIDELVDISNRKTNAIHEGRFKSTNTGKRPSEKLSEDQNNKLKSIMIDSLKENEILKNTKNDLKSQLSKEEIEEIIKLHKSPLFIKTTKYEEEASSPEGVKKLQEFALEFSKTPPSDERIKLVQKLDNSLKISKTTYRWSFN